MKLLPCKNRLAIPIDHKRVNRAHHRTIYIVNRIMLQMEISTEPINSQIMRTSPRQVPRATSQTTIVLILSRVNKSIKLSVETRNQSNYSLIGC